MLRNKAEAKTNTTKEMTEAQIFKIIDQLKDYGERLSKGKNEPVYFNEEHRKISEHAEALSYHAEFGVFPDKLISSAVPNESPQEFAYRKANYKQVTKPAWDKAQSFIYRIFNEQNYSINWKEMDYEEFFTYLFPKYEDFVSFFVNVISKRKFADPNTVAVARPYSIPTKEDFDEEGNPITVIDQSAMIEPYIELFKAKYVFEFKEGEYALLKREQKSLVTVSGKKSEGLIFDLYDKNVIYRITQVGEKEDYNFEVVILFEHNYDSLPAWKLKGIPVYMQDYYYYHSYFSGALPNLDQAAVLNSTQFGVINKVAYPTRWYFEDDCGTCNGDKFVYQAEVKTICGTCNGTGKGMNWSFGKDYVIPMPENLTSSDTTGLPTPPFGTHDPGTNAIEFLDKKVKDLLEGSFLMLNIDIGSKPNGQTATESTIDREEAFSLLLQIAREDFGTMQAMFDAMGFMRYGEGYEENRITIIAPSEFTIRGSEALTDEFAKATEAGLPEPYKAKILMENMKQRFKGDALNERIFEIVSQVDPLMTKSDQEIATMSNQGFIQKWQAVLHANIYRYINQKMSENDKFLDGEIFTEILPVLTDLAKGEIPIVGKTADQILAEIANAG